MLLKLKVVIMQLNAFACFIYILFLECNTFQKGYRKAAT